MVLIHEAKKYWITDFFQNFKQSITAPLFRKSEVQKVIHSKVILSSFMDIRIRVFKETIFIHNALVFFQNDPSN